MSNIKPKKVASIKRYIKFVKRKMNGERNVRKEQPAVLIIRFKAGEDSNRVRSFLATVRKCGGRKVSAHFLRKAILEKIERVTAR